MDGPEALLALAGHHVGTSDWVRITVDQRTLFDRATAQVRSLGNDVDEFLVLARAGALVPTICQVLGRRRGVNYGLDGAVFSARMRQGEAMRVRLDLGSATGTQHRVDAVWVIRVEVDRGGDVVEVCRARSRTRYLF